MLRQAKEECSDWRDEPTAVLVAYARLCQAQEQRQANQTMRMPLW